MSFASPERWLWLLAAIPIIAFYILRSRLRKRKVATLLFWDQLFDQKRQRSLWQNLRHWVSLLLQLLLVGLLTFSLVDPLWQGQQQNAREVVIVLDNSASMNAIDANGRSRFDDAIQLAQQVVSSLRDGDEAALVTAGSQIRVVVGMTDFPPAIRDAIATLTPTDGPTKVIEAVEMARRLTRSPDRRDLVVISDFCFAQAAELQSADDVRLLSAGEKIDNVAITAFAVRRSLVDPIGYAAMITIENLADAETSCRLSLDLADDPVDVYPLKLAPGERWSKTIVGASAQGGLLRATINSNDALASDNQASAVLPERPAIPVVLVTEQPSLYLESVLRAIPQVQLVVNTIAPATAPAGGFMVLNRVVPQSMPTGRVLVIDPRADSDRWTLGEKIDQALVAKQDDASPLMPHVRLTNVLLPGAYALELKPGASPLITDAGGHTLMASIVDGDQRTLVLSTDLDQSDLPLRIAFPVLMTNAVNWFLNRSGEMEPSLRTGQLAEVDIPSTHSHDWAVRDQSGSVQPLTITGERAIFGPIDHVGLIQMGPRTALPSKRDGQSSASTEVGEDAGPSLNDAEVRLLAVNLCDAGESDLRPRVELDHADPRLAGAGQRSLWFYLALGALGFVTVEWILYQRRIVA